MSEQIVHVQAASLKGCVNELLVKSGMNAEDALFCAGALVQTNLWGVDSHGVLRLPVYIKRMQSGATKANPEIKTIKGSHGLEILDGDGGHGFIVGKAAMSRAIRLAEKHNIAAVGAIRSNHFGAAALYARMAAEEGMIGICATNVVQNVAVEGGAKPVVGNNPIAVAVPTYGEFPFVLDIAMSAVAGGKLLMASKKGEKIPLNWATDSDGRPTDDPDKGFAGFLLPMAGHKGFGLALVVDILCGVITGGAFLDQMKGMYRYPDEQSLTGHFMIAVNVNALMGKDEMKSRMDAFKHTVKSSPMWDSSREMLVPGELEYRTAKEREKNGIPLPVALYDELNALAKELDISKNLREITPNP